MYLNSLLPSTLQAKVKTFLLTSVALGSFVSLNGCSYLEPYKAPITQGNIMFEESISLLQEGLSQEQVRKLLGPPMGQNAFNSLHWEYLYYTTDKKPSVNERKHITMDFDQEGYLLEWTVADANVEMKEDDSFLGLF